MRCEHIVLKKEKKLVNMMADTPEAENLGNNCNELRERTSEIVHREQHRPTRPENKLVYKIFKLGSLPIKKIFLFPCSFQVINIE